MNETRVFVSSTCYDLRELREALYSTISNLGHLPLMSEYDSFPVLPETTTVENCRRVIRESTDIFLLVLGGKRGSIDPKSKKSIVEIEFETSEQSGIPALVFVRKSVIDILPLWEKNPTADFSTHADVAALEFLRQVKQKSQWIYSFDRVADIQGVLALRLSELLRHLLEKRRAGKLDALREFQSETPRALELAREKPSAWEYLLTVELLRSKLSGVRTKLTELENGSFYRKTNALSRLAAFKWLGVKFTDIVNLTKALVAAPADLQAAWGPHGTPGDPIAIKRAVEKIIGLCDHAVDWEAELIFTDVPSGLESLQSSMFGTTKGIFSEMDRFVEQLERPLREDSKVSGVVTIELIFAEPATLPKINAEIERVRKSMEQRPLDWVD